jgi:hypothetical protein
MSADRHQVQDANRRNLLWINEPGPGIQVVDRRPSRGSYPSDGIARETEPAQGAWRAIAGQGLKTPRPGKGEDSWTNLLRT